MVPVAFNSPSFQYSNIPFALEAVSHIAIAAFAIIALAGRLSGRTMVIGTLGAAGGATLFNGAQGKLRERKWEVLIQTSLTLLICLSWALISQFSKKPYFDFAVLNLSLLVLPLLFMTVQIYRSYLKHKMVKNTAALDGISCKEIAIDSVEGPVRAHLAINNQLPFEIIGDPKKNSNIKIATYNVAFMPLYIHKINKVTDPVKRVDLIIKRIENDYNLGRLPEVYKFQECFCPKATKKLIACLAKFYPNILFSIAPFQGKVGLDSGLLIASKFEISASQMPSELIEYIDYRCSGIDGISKKGAIAVTLQDSSGEKLRVINTHLVDGPGMQPTREQRRQMSMAQHLFGKGPVIISGDFNSQSEYVWQEFDDVVFVQYDKGSFYKNGELGTKAMDQIGYKGDQFQEIHIQSFADIELLEGDKYSDHRRIVAVINYKRSNPLPSG